MKFKWLYLLAFVNIFFFTSSCKKEQPPCYQPTETQINFEFVSRKLIQIDSIRDGQLIDTLIIQYQDTFLNNSLIYTYDQEQNFGVQNAGNSMRINSPLNPSTNQISYVFQMDTSIHILDTMSLQYETHREFVSNACGFIFNYEILNFNTTRNNIDSFIIFNKQISTENEANIQLYFY